MEHKDKKIHMAANLFTSCKGEESDSLVSLSLYLIKRHVISDVHGLITTTDAAVRMRAEGRKHNSVELY